MKDKHERVRWKGVQITELNREELMDALVEFSELHQQIMEEHRRQMDFLKNFRK